MSHRRGNAKDGSRRGRPKGAVTGPKCEKCGQPPSKCQCPGRKWRKVPVDEPLTGAAPAAPAPSPSPSTATAPVSVAPQAPPAPGGNGTGAFAALPVGDAALKVDPAGAVPSVFQAPAAPTTPPAPGAAGSTPVNPGAIAAAVSAASGPDPTLERAQVAEKVALSAEDVAQLRAISVTACQGIFFLNNWAMGRYYYKIEVLDMPPPLPAHVAAGADLLQPVITRLIGTHTTLGAVLAFGAVLGQHNVALARSIAKTRATAIKQAAEDETAATKAALSTNAAPAPPPSAPPPPPSPDSNRAPVEGMRLQAVVPEIRKPAR